MTDLRHAQLVDYRIAQRLTKCGRPYTGTGLETDPACHICLPDQAHPLAEVWAMCERWDDNANVGAGEPR